jgi:hypothetical protein
VAIRRTSSEATSNPELLLQRQLGLGFVAEAGYVATRQVRQLGYLDINAGQVIGADQVGRPLLQQFGRTAATTFIVPLGTGQYNGMQARLERRFTQGLQLSAHYTWSKAIGPVDNTDSSPSVKAIPYFARNRVPRGYDRPHNLRSPASGICRRQRKAMAERGDLIVLVSGGSHQPLSFYSGSLFTVTSSANLLLPGSADG